MALQVWLPLNKSGDLSNKGLANVTVTNNGATYNSNGKIGGCYKVNGALLSIPSASYMEMKSGKLFSFACWAKGATSSGWFIACSGWEIQFLTGHINVYPGGSSNNRDSKFNGTTAADLWRHIAFTWDGSNLILYVDGNALNTSTFDVSYNISSNINFCYEGERYLNDVRIYDHCLSPKEVKEISKGLVLHYTLDEQPINRDLLNGSRQNTYNSNNEYINLFDMTSIIDTNGAGKLYTVSFDAKADINHSFNVYGSYGSNPKYLYTFSSIEVTTEWQHFSKTFTPTLHTESSTWSGVSLYGVYNSGAIIHVRNIKFELGNAETPFVLEDQQIHDSSGYNNNGTVSGTLTTSTDTPRYDKCYTFGGNKLISTTASGSHILTMSIWAKDAGSIPSDGLMFKDHLGDMALGILSNILYSGKSGGGGAGSVSISSISYTTNTWHHWVMVNRNGTYYVYMDGLQVLSGTSGSWGAGSVNALHIGGRSGSSPWPGKLSDFRAYCTALSVDDIKALYQEAAFIDHKGNVGCYLFEENVVQYNMLGLALEAISKKQFNNLLVNGSSLSNGYVQLVDEGLRIYKAPNISGSLNSGGTSNWCGMVIRNTNNQLNLENNHTYVIMCDIKGHSETNLTDTGWKHSVGWNYSLSGIVPHPSNVVIHDPVVSGFNSDTYKHYSYKFTINDGVYKVATSSYLAHTEGLTYLSYNDFKIGYTYSLTGPDGTEIYINNLRMFDITSNTPIQIDINKQGLIEAFTFTENGDNAFIDSYYGMNSNQLIEI